MHLSPRADVTILIANLKPQPSKHEGLRQVNCWFPKWG